MVVELSPPVIFFTISDCICCGIAGFKGTFWFPFKIFDLENNKHQFIGTYLYIVFKYLRSPGSFFSAKAAQPDLETALFSSP